MRKQYLKSVVWAKVLYASETWTILKQDEKRIEAFEMWCWHQMMRTKWQDKIKNETVLEMVKERKTIMEKINRQQKQWVGHILRGNGLLKLAIEGMYTGKPKRGRKRITLMNRLLENKPYDILKRRAENRNEWRYWSPGC